MAFISTTSARTAIRTGRRASLFDLVSLYRQRRALACLDNRALQDLGLTREDALKEARRGFWDVPHHWVK